MAGWGQCGKALRGRPVFVTRYNVGTSSWFTYQGYGMTRLAQHSIIHGTQYSWERKTRHPSTALLWRTMRDTDTVERVSGSVLCLGQIHEETAQALLFQNFEGSLMATDHVQISPDEDSPSFKGGLLLPQEVRNSQIITAPHTQPQSFHTPPRSHGSGFPGRHDLTV